jgi:hypothetical protein
MLKKFKSLFIILLVMSLSFVPYVNAASDIFDEPVHVDYETYKERLVEYIETPDYLKASMPPIIGKNEYITYIDIITASDDLVNMLPNINDAINEVKTTPLFKTMNNVILDHVKTLIQEYDPTDANIEYYLKPYVKNSGIDNIQYFKQYTKIAKDIQDVIHDNVLMEQNGKSNPYFSRDKTVIFDGNTYTIDELFNRINGATIDPNGYYVFEDNSPLASQSASIADESLIVGPKKVAVDEVATFLSDNYYTTTGDYGSNLQANVMMHGEGGPEFYDINFFDLDIHSGQQCSPKLLLDNDNIPVIKTQRTQYGRFYVKEAEFRTEKLGDGTDPMDIKPNNIEIKKAEMGIPEFDDMSNAYAQYKESDVLVKSGALEGGVMLIVAIITLILAWVYK